MRFRRQQTRSSGFTLAEMVIVLLILATVTMIAVESTHSLGDATKFESTKATLENIKKAILCVEQTSTGAPAVRGFFVDMGRLPNPALSYPLLELLAEPSGFAFDVQSTELGSMASGWNGPYLRLPPGHAEHFAADFATTHGSPTGFLDGWNYPIDYIYYPDNDPRVSNPVAVGAEGESLPIVTIRSRGADHAIDDPEVSGGTYDRDIVVHLYATDLYAKSLTFRAYERDPLGTGPAPLTEGTLALNVYRINADNADYELVPCALTPILDEMEESTNIYEMSRPNVRVGKIAVQAVKTNSSGIVSRSAPLLLTVMPSAVETHTFVLPPALDTGSGEDPEETP